MCHALASSGGFCAGAEPVVDHQRLSGAGYCYSASMPALLAVAAQEALRKLAAEPARIAALRRHRATLVRLLGEHPHLSLVGDAHAPFVHVRVKAAWLNRTAEEFVLQEMVDEVRAPTDTAALMPRTGAAARDCC